VSYHKVENATVLAMKRVAIILVAITVAFPFVASADIVLDPDVKNPILFLPGIQASRLYSFSDNGNFERVWEPLGNSDLRELEMTENGESVNDIRVGQVIDRIFGIGEIIYGKNDFDTTNQVFSNPKLLEPLRLEDSLTPETQKYFSAYQLWVAYPYDWRYDVFDIIRDGTLRMDGERQYLVEVVEALAEKSGKINIVAHSNGGLLAKALMVHLEEIGKEELVEKIFLVGTPQLGTPEAIGGLLHGYKQSRVLGLVTNSATSREISKNMPGAYALLPSPAYFERIETPVVTHSISGNPVGNIPSGPLSSYQNLFDFLTGKTFTRNDPFFVDAPITLRENLLEKAKATHARIDAWTPGPETTVTEFAGVGNETAISFSYRETQASYCPIGRLVCIKRNAITYSPIFSFDGDSTVVSPSGILGDGYYLDLNKLSLETDRAREHKNLLAEEELLLGLAPALTGEVVTSDFLTTEKPIIPTDRNHIAISVHSPVIISAEDNLGNITSVEYDTDPSQTLLNIREEIPESFVEIIGEGKYIFLPEGNYEISITGTDVGSFDLLLSELNDNGELQETEKYSNIPVTASSTAATTIETNTLSSLTLDIEGDGTNDFTFSEDGANAESIKTLMISNFAALDLRPTLHSAIDQYFALLETETDEEVRATIIAQLDRITQFLDGRYITQETANAWRAFVRNLE